MTRRSHHPRPFYIALCLLAVASFSGCGDDGGGAAQDAAAVGDGGPARTDGAVPRADAGQGDSGARTDGSVADAGLTDGDAMTSDAGAWDAGPGDADGGADGRCACDVTSLCDTGCACDIACSITPGDPPLGDDAMLMERAELLVVSSSSPGSALDRVSLFDDGYIGTGGPMPAYRALVPTRARAAIAERPAALAADVDGDGREEVLLVTSTQVLVEDWSSGALTERVVRTYPAGTEASVAAGDLTGDGVPDLVVSRQRGDATVVELLSVGTSGDATLLGSTMIEATRRHALAVGRPSASAPEEIYVVTGADGLPGTLEALTLWRFTAPTSADTLTRGPMRSLSGECLVPRSPDDERLSVAVGNMDGDATSEIAVALYCPGGDLFVQLYETGAPDGRLIGVGPHADDDTVGAYALQPLLAITNTGPTARSTPRLVVGVQDQSGSFSSPLPTARVMVLSYAPGGVLRETDGETFEPGTILTSLTTRDLTRDGVSEIVAGYTQVERLNDLGRECAMFDLSCHLEETGFAVERLGAAFGTPPLLTSSGSRARSLSPGPVVVAGDLDADSIRVRATGNVYLHTGRPFVNAVLAAPPTWRGRTGVAHGDDGSTSFGTAMSMGTTDTRTINASASATVSAGASFGVVEFSASVTASFEFSSSMSLSRTVSYGTETSVGEDANLVLFRAVPYASYEYRVVSHPNPAEIGTLMTVDVPGHMIETVRTLDAFRDEYGAAANDVIPANLFTHTIGDPATYPAPGACNDTTLEARLGAGSVSALAASPALVDVGNATSGARTQSISVGMQTGMSTEISLSVEMSVGVGAGGVSVEASAGIGTSSTHETTVGRDVTYTGSVGYLAEGYGIDTRYEWGLCVFHYTNRQYGAYPVIGYVVRRY